MAVNKKLLAQKTDKELLKYVQPESRFTRLAIQYAYEILLARGHSFTDEETEHINFLLRDKEKREEIYIHANHTQGATLMYICAGLSMLNMIVTHNDPVFGGFMFIKVVAVIFLAGMGFLISRGIGQVKYILILNQLILIFGLVPLLFLVREYPAVIAISLIQSALQVYVIILLFQVPK
jgi:hypothetical protein